MAQSLTDHAEHVQVPLSRGFDAQLDHAEWLVHWTPELASWVRCSTRSCRVVDALHSGAHHILVATHLGRMLSDTYLCLLVSNKQQIEEVRSKT